MVKTADIDKSANANWGIRQVSCFFPVYFCLYEENQKGHSSDLPLLGPQGGPKMQIQAKWSIQIVNKLIVNGHIELHICSQKMRLNKAGYTA